MREQPHRPPRGTLGRARLPRRAGDVEVRPAVLAGVAAQEHRGGNRPAGTRPHIAHVGEVALQCLVVFLVQRHPPAGVERALCRGLELRRHRVVGGEQAGMVMTKGDHAGTGQRGHVDDDGRLEAFGVGQCVAQDQPALGIGVEDLDRLPRQARHHVARLDGAAARHVLARRHDADEVELRREFGHGAQRAEHARRTAHVELHLVHLGARLDRDAATVEGDALADQHHRRLALRRTPVVGDDEARRLVRAPRHGQEGPHAELLEGLAVQHLDLDPVRLAEPSCLLGQNSGRAMVAGPVGQLLRQRHAGGHGAPARQTLLARPSRPALRTAA